jgi:hypothetical protein
MSKTNCLQLINQHTIRSSWGKWKFPAERKENAMHKNSRVLGRMGARELTLDETEYVTGSIRVHTDVCSRPFPGSPTTLTGDGDACTDL